MLTQQIFGRRTEETSVIRLFVPVFQAAAERFQNAIIQDVLMQSTPDRHIAAVTVISIMAMFMYPVYQIAVQLITVII